MKWICASAIGLVVLASALPSAAQGKRADLDGVWILADSATFEHLELTPAGEAGRAKYDYVMNDPGMKCIPASITRVMHTPSPPTEIRQDADHVEIDYEFMDVHRRVPIIPGVAAKDVPYAVATHPHLGRSVASLGRILSGGCPTVPIHFPPLLFLCPPGQRFLRPHPPTAGPARAGAAWADRPAGGHRQAWP